MRINLNIDKFIVLLLIINVFVFFTLIGCSREDVKIKADTNSSNEVPPISSNENNSKIDKDAPEVKVIYDFAEDINNEKYTEAFSKLGSMLKKAYSGPDDIHFKNIHMMEVEELIDKTDEHENGKWDINSREIGENIYSYKVYYACIKYNIRNIAESYLKNGMNYHKITVYKETQESEWKIGEMSGTDKIMKK